jgi:hypothetical protein
MKTSPSTFASLIDKVVGDLQNVVTYFDDFIIFSDTFDERLNHLRNVFGRLRKANLSSHCQNPLERSTRLR